MCGIAGLWKFKGGKVDQPAFDRFIDSLRHRGPDGRGVWHDESAGVALGQRRLAILDCTDDGRQPMSYSEGRYWMVYNGEVFNFLELRKDLEQKGFQFRSQSDTEVILAAYIQWGAEMLPKFNGMWALAIYDRAERALFIARDRFGIKPFHYVHDGAKFAFASELKSFKHLEGFRPEMDAESARVFLDDSMAVEGTIRTMVKDVRRLQGGHWGLLKDGRLTIRRWWNTLEHLPTPPARFEDQAEQFRELFEDAVRLRMRSDVPVGTCLSGGFDSSAVVCALARFGRERGHERQAGDWQKTFVASFPGAENDETAMAEKVIQYAGVQGNFLALNESDALNEIDRVLSDFDDVYFNLPTHTWAIYRFLRQNRVYVSLDGHGADELMGAYRPAEQVLMSSAPGLLSHPGENLRRIREAMALQAPSSRPATGAGRMRKGLSWTLAYHPSLGWMRDATRRMRASLRKENRFYRGEPVALAGDFAQVAASDVLPEHWGRLNRDLYRMFHCDVLPTILRNFDRTSMSHGIEIRMPFMDWRLVCFIMSLPEESKISAGATKRVAREAMKGRMPEEIRASKVKIGFNSPLPLWLRGPLKDWARDVIQDSNTEAAAVLDLAKTRNYLRECETRGVWSWPETVTVWRLVHYAWFASRFFKA
jgi:asparagine synthase (glutamine-hydrolysing)